MTKAAYILLILSMAIVGNSTGSEEPHVEDLFTVYLMGTDIEQIPNYITVIANDPKTAMRETQERMDSIDDRLHYMFYSQGGRGFGYCAPEDWHYEGIELTPEAGDVIYTFCFRDTASMESFSKKYALKEFQKSKDAERYLYQTDEHFYVITEVAAPIYTCPMHPGITAPKQGPCPICGIMLVENNKENADDPLALTAIYWNQKDPLVTINGENFRVGDKVLGNTILEIRKLEVVFRSPEGNEIVKPFYEF